MPLPPPRRHAGPPAGSAEPPVRRGDEAQRDESHHGESELEEHQPAIHAHDRNLGTTNGVHETEPTAASPAYPDAQ